MDALVADAHLRNSVAGIRGLGASGLDVVALGRSRASAGVWSRHAAARHIAASSTEAPKAFVAKIRDVAIHYGPLVVYPGQENSIDALIRYSAALPAWAILPYSGAAALRRLRDKRELPTYLADVGLRAPTMLAYGTAQELLKMSLPEPCVVKPVGGPGRTLPFPQVIESSADGMSLLRRLPPGEPLLVQEHVRGPLLGLGLVVDRHGGIVARIQQSASFTWPVHAGGSRMAVTVEPDEDLADRSAALLASAGYWGLAHLQFLQGDGRPVLIDVNTRFYGSLPLALAAGVNLPAAWHAIATGSEPPPPSRYRVGVTYRWFVADLAAAYRGSPKRLFSRAPNPRVGAMWAADDPVASGILAGEAMWAAAKRRLPTGSG